MSGERPVQLPLVTVSSWPTVGFVDQTEICGRTVFTGGFPITSGVDSDCAVVSPNEFFAVTSTRSDQPIRSPVGRKVEKFAAGVRIR